MHDGSPAGLALRDARAPVDDGNRHAVGSQFIRGSDPDDPGAMDRASQAAALNISAARSFNRGLRNAYFALGSMTWLLGAVPLMIGVVLTVGVLFRREFASHSREVLMRNTPK